LIVQHLSHQVSPLALRLNVSNHRLLQPWVSGVIVLVALILQHEVVLLLDILFLLIVLLLQSRW